MPIRRTRIRAAEPDHQIVTLEGGRFSYRRTSCGECPWRIDQTGTFPAEAFRHSAETAYDMALATFACHTCGPRKPAICAGFLVNGATHSLAVRLALLKGTYRGDANDGGHALHVSYRAMAIANGVAADDPRLVQCRDPNWTFPHVPEGSGVEPSP